MCVGCGGVGGEGQWTKAFLYMKDQTRQRVYFGVNETVKSIYRDQRCKFCARGGWPEMSKGVWPVQLTTQINGRRVLVNCCNWGKVPQILSWRHMWSWWPCVDLVGDSWFWGEKKGINWWYSLSIEEDVNVSPIYCLLTVSESFGIGTGFLNES